MRRPIGIASALLLLGGAGGCAHVDRARAEAHEERAERAAKHGHFGKAIKEERKADRAARDAERDPLP